MNKLFLILLLLLIAGNFISSNKIKSEKDIAKKEIIFFGNINEDGSSIKERIRPPEGFKRNQYREESFQFYIQNYKLKPFGSKVINYNGKPYVYQNGQSLDLEYVKCLAYIPGQEPKK